MANDTRDLFYGPDGGYAEEMAAENLEGGRNDERFSALDADTEAWYDDCGDDVVPPEWVTSRDLTGWVLQPVPELDLADVPF